MLGEAGKQGPALAVGVMTGTSVLAPQAALSFSVPATVGLTAGPVQVWAGGAITAYPTRGDALGVDGTLLVPSAEGGLAIDAGGYPVYVSAGYVTGPLPLVTTMIGVGYLLE